MNACKTMDGRAVASLFAAAMIVCVASAATRAQVTVRTSVATGGLQANDDSYGPALSADGRFAAPSYPVLCGDQYCGLGTYLQVLEVDPGASQGVSFSQGLELTHGH